MLRGDRSRWVVLLALGAIGIGTPTCRAAAISDWEVATAVPTRLVRLGDSYPHFTAIFALDWQPLQAGHDGWIDLAPRLTALPDEPHTVLARSFLRAESWQPLALTLAYRDAIMVFWNEQPVFRGAAPDSTRPAPQGTVFLRAAPGLNEIMVALTGTRAACALRAETDRALAGPLVDHTRLTEVWRTEADLRTPESVAYDPRRDELYVSNFNLGFNPAATEPAQFTGYLSRLSRDGRILELEWVKQLKAPAGICLAGDTLWVVERGAVAQVDVTRGVVVARIPVPGSDFLNDIAIGPDGSLYVSDTRTANPADSRIYRIAEGQVSVWVGAPDIRRSNGLFRDGSRLLVGNSGDGLLKAIDLAGRRVEVVAALGGGIQDGLRVTPDGEILVSHWEGKIFAVSADGGVVEIADLKREDQNAADYEFLAEERLLIVPTFGGNRVIAYRLEPAR